MAIKVELHMPTIAYIADTSSAPSQIYEIVSLTAISHGAIADRIDRLSTKQPAVHQLWDLLSRASLVVAYVAGGSTNLPNLMYEIGLAHGQGKPVILLTDTRVKLPPDLLSQYLLHFGSEDLNSGMLAFRLSELFKRLLSTRDYSLNVWGPTAPAKQIQAPSEPATPDTIPNNPTLAATQLNYQLIRELPTSQRPGMFVIWLELLLRSIPGFDVEAAEISHGHRDEGYDFTIWNDTQDPDFAVLGNPIPIETKAWSDTRHLRPALNQLIAMAKKQNLKSAILATTAQLRSADFRQVKELFSQSGIFIVLLDHAVLSNVLGPQDLLNAIKTRVLDLLYGSEANV